MPLHCAMPTFVVLMLFGSLACSDSPSRPDDSQPTGRIDAFMNALRQQGATVARMEQLSSEAYCLSVAAWRLVVSGENVYAFSYDTVDAAIKDTSTISSDGTKIAPVGRACAISWMGPPRFYRQDRLIVLYVDGSDSMMRLLDTVLGPPFAHP